MKNKTERKNSYFCELIKQILESDKTFLKNDKKDLILKEVTSKLDNEIVDRLNESISSRR